MTPTDTGGEGEGVLKIIVTEGTLEGDRPAQTALLLWEAFKNRDIKKILTYSSTESKGFLAGYLHSLKAIDAAYGDLQEQLQSEEILEVIQELIEPMLNIALDYVPIAQPIYSGDGLRADVKLLSKDDWERYKNVTFVRPTTLPMLTLPMVLEMVAFTYDNIKYRWRLDWLRLYASLC